MPRGRKGPPQDSIESILLAICRRDNIDPETMSHYFDRLDEEWAKGAREKVMHLLRSNDASAHAAAVLILSELATDFDLEGLEDFITDPTVSDVAKLSLSPILRELGSEMADDGIMEYLNDPTAAIQQMQARLLELVGHSEIGVESILEDVISMPVERRLAFVTWLGNSNDPRATNLLIPLLENQPSKMVLPIIDALEQLGPLAAHQTIPALHYMVATSSNRQLKQHARTALGRLTMQSALGIEDVATIASRRQSFPIHEARVSFIDGSGSQLIMLSWLRPDGRLKGVNVLYQDQYGIKDCYGVDEIDVERWNTLAADLNKQGFGSFQAPFEYGRELILEARLLNKRTRHKLPVAYSIWRPLLEVGEPGKKRASAVTTLLAPRALDPDTIALAQRGGNLYTMTEFFSWIYEPTSSIEPYVTRYWSAYNTVEVSSKRSRGRKGKPKEPEGEQQALLEELVNEALDQVINDKWRMLYETRLRRQAALFQLIGREEDASLVSAVAAVLHPDSHIPIHEQAFPRAMIRFSIEKGPFRMIVDSLGGGHLSPMSIDLFDEE